MRRYLQNIFLVTAAILAISGCNGHNASTGLSISTQEVSVPLSPAINSDTLSRADSTAAIAKLSGCPIAHTIGGKHITTKQKDTVYAGDVMLFIDSGAVSRDVEISIETTTEKYSGEIPSNMENLTAGGIIYRMLPDGQRFEKDITIAMRYDSTALPYGFTPYDIYTFFYDEQSRTWQQVERDSVDTQNQIVYSRTTHFTDYINGVLKVPENSDATSYTPTSIKDLKAADPMEGITLIAPPEANSMGTVNLSYPITIPAGRHGMQPQLTVNYNSSGGSGILGLGWSLPISEISVETRWGVPVYSQLYETESYLLDGVTLVTSHLDSNNNFQLDKPVYHDEARYRYSADTLRFYQRVEGTFRKIERIGNSPQDYYWVVTDKNGTRHFYGQSGKSRLTDFHGNIAKWMIEKSVDTYGNTIIYYYTTHYRHNDNERAGRQICINRIRYTGIDSTADRGQYIVRFYYNEKKDKSNSFRYGLEEIDSCLLDRIEVSFRDSLVREYYFGYKMGALGRTLLCNILESYDDSASVQRYSHEGDSYVWRLSNPYDRCGLIPESDTAYVPHLHIFDYYGDSLEIWNKAAPIVDPTYNTFSNGLLLNLLPAPLRGFGEQLNRYSLNVSSSYGYTIGGGVNVGFDKIPNAKTFSVGGHFSFSKNHSEGLLTYIDLDGDGYPDKIYKDLITGLKFQRQIPGGSGETLFDSPVELNGVKGFLRTESSTNNWGVEASAWSAGAGVNWSDTRSSTYTYFTDINGDGLIDIVDNGTIFVNRGGLNFSNATENDTILFGGGCGENVYYFDGEVEDSLFKSGYYVVERKECNGDSNKEDIYDTLYDEHGQQLIVNGGIENYYSEQCSTYFDTVYYTFPQRYEPDIDLVRMWKAPYQGTIHISGVIRLADSLDTMRLRTRTMDGVWISIQKAQIENSSLWDTVVVGNPVDVNLTTSVNAGDTLYFRIAANEKRLYDVVQWNPHIRYTAATLRDGTSVTNTSLVDENGDSVYVFDYGTDFLLDGSTPVSLCDTTNIACSNSFQVKLSVKSVRPLSQDLVYSLVKKSTDVNGSETIIPMDTIPHGSPFNTTFIDTVDLTTDKCLSVRISPSGGGQVQWSAVETDATVTLLSSTCPTIDTLITDSNISKSFVYHPVADYVFYDYLAYPPSPINTLSGTPTLHLSINTAGNQYSGNALITVKDAGNSTCLQKTVSVTNGTANVSFPSFIFNNGTTYYFDCYFDTPEDVLSIENIKMRIGNGTAQYDVGVYTKYSSDINKHHGTLYRGWGQFGYKNNDSTNRYIQRALTVYEIPVVNTPNISQQLTDNEIRNLPLQSVSHQESPSSGLIYNPLGESFFEMKADGLVKRWVSFGNAVTASKYFASLDSREDGATDSVSVDKFQSPMPTVLPGQKRKAVNKLWLNEGRGTTVLLLSNSSGTTRMLGDYMDLNGDRYPDIVTDSRIQFSKALGGLSDKVVGYDGSCNQTNHSSEGLAFNGTFINALRQIANNPSRSSIECLSTGQSQLPGNLDATFSKDSSQSILLDVNSDGLPDILYSDGHVRYNMGYGFTSLRSFTDFSSIQHSESRVVSVGTGFNLFNSSITGGLSDNKSQENTQYSLLDINGDGLLDKVSLDSIWINRGDGTFISFDSSGVVHSHSQSLSLNASLTVDVPLPSLIPGLFFKAGGSISGGVTATTSVTEAEYIDMDNDGNLDYVYKKNDGRIWVKYSRIGETNLLRSVSNFANARFEITYGQDKSTLQCPQRHWNMTRLTIYDGHDGEGADTMYRRFEYGRRVYDRYERDDYGYDTVITYEYISSNDTAYRSTTQVFHNDNYYHARLKRMERLSQGSKSVETIYEYADASFQNGEYLNDSIPVWCHGSGWPAVMSEECHYSEDSGGIVSTKVFYAYDRYGNVTQVDDYGDMNDLNDDYHVKIEYAYNPSRYIVENVSLLDIHGYRHREAIYNDKGSMVELRVDNSPNPLSVYQYHFDPYGNVDRVQTPAVQHNTNNNYWIQYRYDSLLHMLPIEVYNAEGHTSTARYSYRWQKPLHTIDIGGNMMRYTYDSHGRTLAITAPKEIDSNVDYTVKYDYWYARRHPRILPGNSIDSTKGSPYCFWARTRNYDPSFPGNDINTVVFSDGLGRIIQVKKDVEVGGNECRAVSGTVHYDALGRKIREFFPISEHGNHPDTNLNINVGNAYCTEITYDYRDRPVLMKYTDSTTATNTYTIATDTSGIDRFLNTITDQNGHISRIFTNPRQQNIQVSDALGSTTLFEYDAIGQLLTSIDPEGNKTSHSYDRGGRRIDRHHPSAGHTHWEYDAAGNVGKQVMNSGEQVAYEYDYHHLMHISYSERPWNDVWYVYGSAGDGNQAGRLVRKQDATGVQEFFYDNMGNVEYNRHTYVQPYSQRTITLETAWQYDSWGRVHAIIYPDYEKVRYFYNTSGDVSLIAGTKPDTTTPTYYIKKLYYDHYGQRVQQMDGNDVATSYEYDPRTRRLKRLYTVSPTEGVLQDNHYYYDAVGNIDSIVDSGYNYRRQIYNYDNANRLIASNGTMTCLGNNIGYTAEYDYSTAGRILKKEVKSTRCNNLNPFYTVDYDNSYGYSPGNPFAVSSINDNNQYITNFDWDANGNLKSVYSPTSPAQKRLCWTEDNRLQGFYDFSEEGGDISAWYNYNDEGERNIKITSPRLDLRQNASHYRSMANLTYLTLYASPLITFNRYGYTKHYFEGTNRICSKMGGGFHFADWSQINSQVEPIEKNYTFISNGQSNSIHHTFSYCLGIDELHADFKDLYDMMVNEYEGTPKEELAYYYHSDHLGSCAYLTNEKGKVIQILNYLPYGEDWVDLQDYSQTLYPKLGTYTFNGKEKDYESGFHYYGARYYWSELLTGWLSVDPLADKYPSISPYAYCAWNPVKLVDPDGREISTHIDQDGNVVAVYDDGNLGVYMHSRQEIASVGSDGILSNDPDNFIGATLYAFSFREGDKIDIGSYQARDWMRQFEGAFAHSFANPIVALVAYAIEAGNGGRYDPKSYMNSGSQLTDGVYVSPRDLGNFAAGYFGHALGLSKERTLASYGAFQLAGNNTKEFLLHYSSYYKQALNIKGDDGVILEHKTYGEKGISNYFQRLGYENIRTINDFNRKYTDIWK